MFQIEARNIYSYSAPSLSVYIFCAYMPEKPDVLATTVVSGDIRVSWTPPYNNGAAIVAYRVEIQQHDGTFSQQLTNCDGSQSAIVLQSYCDIPILSLLYAPYTLSLGDPVLA